MTYEQTLDVYTVRLDNVVVMRFRANLAQASAPIQLGPLDPADDEDEGWQPTPYQTADARHIAYDAAILLNDWCRSEGGEQWDTSDDDRITIDVD